MEENLLLKSNVELERSLSYPEENAYLQENYKAKRSPNESEYDSAGSYSEGEYKEKEGDSDRENDSEGSKSLILERQEGDGQESIPQKKVDDDEDKKNPQYIPKRGTFYEHDDRTADDLDAAETEEKEIQEKDTKKKLWQDKKESWAHDRFNDQEQAPKSKSELIQIYGYDIRNEDGPPRARRRRRYGRGPNKYTRNWEDEDAYNKPIIQKPKKPQNPPTQSTEEFPPLDQRNTRSKKSSETREFSPKNNKENNDINKSNRRSEEREELPAREHIQNTNNVTNASNAGSTSSSIAETKTPKIGSGRVKSGSEPPEPKNMNSSEIKGFTSRVRMGRNFKNQNSSGRNQKKDDFIHSQTFSSKRNSGNSGGNLHDLENSIANMNVQDSKGKSGNNQRQGSVPPRLQGEQKGSKRYSSMRQRSLPETNNPPVMQHSNYYGNDMNPSQPGQAPGQVMHPNPNLLQSPAAITQLAGPPNLPLQQQVPVTATPILQAPPQFAPAFPQAPAFIQAAVPPPAFIPQQAPPLINYVQTTPQYPAGYQSYQAPFNPVAVTQPTELYQPQGGITYYSTDQQIIQRTAPPKRPKAAIPIVAPPSFDPKNPKDERQLDYSSETNSIDEK